MKRATKRQLARELVKRCDRGTNWENSSEDFPYYFNEYELYQFVCWAMSKAMIKKCINEKLYIHEGLYQYVNSSGNQCGDYQEIVLYCDSEELNGLILFTNYSEEYAKKWCK